MSHILSRVSTELNDDPRAVRSREAILQAVIEILAEEGPGAITHQRVAERAGVGRATVYRHWPQPVDLLADVIGQFPVPFLEEPGRNLRERLWTTMRRLGDDFRIPIMRAVISSLLEKAQHDEGARELRDIKIGVVHRRMREAVEEGLASGALTGDPDPEALVARLMGPLIFRILMQDLSISDRFIDEVLDGALAPYQP